MILNLKVFFSLLHRTKRNKRSIRLFLHPIWMFNLHVMARHENVTPWVVGRVFCGSVAPPQKETTQTEITKWRRGRNGTTGSRSHDSEIYIITPKENIWKFQWRKPRQHTTTKGQTASSSLGRFDNKNISKWFFSLLCNILHTHTVGYI